MQLEILKKNLSTKCNESLPNCTIVLDFYYLNYVFIHILDFKNKIDVFKDCSEQLHLDKHVYIQNGKKLRKICTLEYFLYNIFWTSKSIF